VGPGVSRIRVVTWISLNVTGFAFVVSCVECLFFSFGTILGTFTIIVLSREPVKALFQPQ
jgi:hypothetical protein